VDDLAPGVAPGIVSAPLNPAQAGAPGAPGISPGQPPVLPRVPPRPDTSGAGSLGGSRAAPRRPAVWVHRGRLALAARSIGREHASQPILPVLLTCDDGGGRPRRRHGCSCAREWPDVAQRAARCAAVLYGAIRSTVANTGPTGSPAKSLRSSDKGPDGEGLRRFGLSPEGGAKYHVVLIPWEPSLRPGSIATRTKALRTVRAMPDPGPAS
jgi:hypothetical protein